jgi:hypothetical protein
MLKEIKNLLGIELSEVEEVTAPQVEASEAEVKLAQMSLEDGTILEAEAFEADNEVFIVTEDEKIALPVGEYALEDGKILVVEEEGIIKEIKEVSGEESEEEAPMEAEASEELAEEVQFATMNDLNELKAMVSELKDMMAKQELSKQEEVEQLKEELSAPAAEPLKHNPEKAEAQHQFKISANRTASTRDRVLSRISNINK